MQKKNLFLFIPEREYLKRRMSIKIRISERNAKENLFLFIPEREYLKPKVKGMVSRVENKINLFF